MSSASSGANTSGGAAAGGDGARDAALFGDTEWSPSQQRAIRAILQEEANVLVTGAGGTGKSTLIAHIVGALRGRGYKVAVLAPTGVAAVTIGGQTTWSWMQFSKSLFEKHTKEEAAAKYKRYYKTAVAAFKATRAIVLDEASMTPPHELEYMDYILQVTRGIYRPFGGIQLVLVGDFFQLPPVSRSGARTFLFQSDVFWRSMDAMHDLTEVWRQSDADFVALLHRLRRGEHTAADLAVLRSRIGAALPCEARGIEPTRLYARNVDVDAVNQTRLDALCGEAVTFAPRYGVYAAASGSALSRALKGKRGTSASRKAIGGGGAAAAAAPAAGGAAPPKDNPIEALQAHLLLDIKSATKLPKPYVGSLADVAVTPLALKVGAQVMLTYNLDVAGGLVNGARGTVIGFALTNAERAAAGKPQRPADAEEAFAKRTDEPLLYPDERLPIVRFAAGGRVIEVPYVRYTREDKGTEAYAWRLALALAWATTIHKSQSLTLDAVEADIAESFDAGMVYVALSRVKSLDALRLTRDFGASAIRVNPDVKAFYAKPFSLQKAEFLARLVDGAATTAAAAGVGATAAVGGAGAAAPRAAAGRGGGAPAAKRARIEDALELEVE